MNAKGKGATVPRILFVMTGADKWTLADGSHHPTEFWAEEFVAQYEALRSAGYDVTVATLGEGSYRLSTKPVSELMSTTVRRMLTTSPRK